MSEKDMSQELIELVEAVHNDSKLSDEMAAEIKSLSDRLSTLRAKRDEITLRLHSNRSQIGPLQRRIAMEDERQRIEQELSLARTELMKLIENIPYPHEPKKFQIDGAVKLAVAKRGLVGDKRGLGKTLTALLWLRMIRSQRSLVMTMSKLIPEMKKQISMWEPDKTVIDLTGMTRLERDVVYPMLKNLDDVIVLLNYEAWRKDETLINHIINVSFDALVLDEVHNAKESQAKVSAGLVQIAPNIPYVLEMTGTPMLNRPQEIWLPLHLLHPDLFPTKKDYLTDFCENYGPNDWRWKHGGDKLLAEKIAPFFIMRDRSMVGIEVPPPAIYTYPVSMDNYPNQEEAYRLLSDRALAVLKSGKIFTMPSLLAIITRQMQMAMWPPGIEFTDNDIESDSYGETFRFDVYESAKLDFIENLIGDLVEDEERVIVFNRFKSPTFELQQRMAKKGIRSVAVTGNTNKYTVQEAFNDFDLNTAPDKPKYDVMLATYKMVGEGVNLNAARHAILADREWNPGREEQATGRIDRMNSTDQATIHIPELQNSVDIFVKGLIDHKTNIIRGFESAVDLQQMLIRAIEAGEF